MLTLRELASEAERFAFDFDPYRLDAHAARSAVEHAARLEKIAASIKGRAAVRLAETGTHRGRGEKSPAHDLAKLSGTSVGQAAETLAAAEKLESLPEVAAAANRGELSAQQTSLIAGALAANPSADAEQLVEKAKTASHNELRNECERIKAAADRGAEERRKRIHDERFLRRSRHADGSASLTLRDNPEVIAQVVAGIQPKRQELFDAARRRGERERSEALDADALVATVAGAGCASGSSRRGTGPGAKVLVRVDFDTLLRGYTLDGEVCEIAGYGPVAVSAVRDLLATGNAFLAAIVTKGEKVVGVAHLSAARPRQSSSPRSSGRTRCARVRDARTSGASSATTASSGRRRR